jgi:hypothetical protein
MSPARVTPRAPVTLPTTPATKPATPPPQAPAPDTAWRAGAARATPTTQAAPPGQAIVCPVLGALVAEGKVPMAADGTVQVADLNHALADAGLSAPYQALIRPTGWGANTLHDVLGNVKGDQFNVLELRAGLIKHPGDSAILTGGQFDEAKFDALVAHARSGVMTDGAFAEAIAANVARDAHGSATADTVTRGKTFSEVEFGALLGAFGTVDPKTGERGIPVDALRNLYQHQTLPPGRSGAGTVANAGAIAASLHVKADAKLAGLALGSFMTATGLASRGAELSTGAAPGSAAAGQAAVSAGKAAACPHLRGGGAAPSGAETLNLHT